jgi:hypothetical protein
MMTPSTSSSHKRLVAQGTPGVTHVDAHLISTTGDVDIPLPQPGLPQSFDLAVTNVTSNAVLPITLDVLSSVEEFFEELDRIVLTLTTANGDLILESAFLRDIENLTVALPDLPPGETLELIGLVELSGNGWTETVGRHAGPTLRFTTNSTLQPVTTDSPTTWGVASRDDATISSDQSFLGTYPLVDAWLAFTGSTPLMAMLIAVLLCAAGATLLYLKGRSTSGRQDQQSPYHRA